MFQLAQPVSCCSSACVKLAYNVGFQRESPVIKKKKSVSVARSSYCSSTFTLEHWYNA